MYRFVYQKSLTVSGVSECRHISRVTSDRVWISGYKGNLILTNTKGEELDHVTDILSYYGGHTVNIYGDLIYIDSELNINKLSTENKVKTTIIKYNNTSPWRPRCVYSSPSTGDLLVAMFRDDPVTVKVVRYNSTGENIQTIQYNNNTGQGLYRLPHFITENRNGDVIVSDFFRHAVVVTDRDGNYRFSYTRTPSGSELLPCGICTDALSHILVCDPINKSVQMLDSDGRYLTEILTSQHGIDRPEGLSYDDDTHLLWVGSAINNTVNLYRVVDTDSLTGLPVEDIKCRKHPRIPLDQFCTPCGVPLCVECTRSEDHSRHDLRKINTLFDNIHRIKDGDTLLMCLLISNSYKINMKEGNWMTKYNAVANIFHSKEVTKPFAPTDLEKYKPILKLSESEISFSNDCFKDISFLKLLKSPKIIRDRIGVYTVNLNDIFLTWAEKENIAEFCRSWNYQRGEDEVCCWLLPEKNEEFLKRLGQDIFKHPTMVDQSLHEAVFRKFGVPIQIIMRGDKSVKKFIANLKKGKTMMYHASGMIIGCAGSGKTTLLQRLKGIDLKEIKENTNPTRGVDIHADVFEVTDSIHVNFSSQQKHFKLQLDKKDMKQSVPESHSVNAADDGERMEPVDEAANTTEASNTGQISHDDTNISMTQTASSNEPRGATSSENVAEVVKESKDIPHSSEISGNLQIGAEDISDDPEKKITMTDFAGQCSYYASHQIFLSPRAFFILVLNMEKKFDYKVGEDVCCQKGSIYGEWTNRDYLEFWMKSVHQYSSDKAPVILVGTHSEEKTEKEKTLFFREVWKTLEMKKSLQKHLSSKRQFAIGFNNNEGIDSMKKSILDVVGKLDHWGEELPRSWAMFETFFHEKKKLNILKIDALIAFNEALPEGIKLQTTDDINVMLQFFHDIREILYFAQVLLREIVILDVQWFADAFKNVITDKNHAEEDLLEFTAEWDKFNETGELPDTLLSAIWEMNNNGYIEHKHDIMLYMEKLGLLAKISENKWYVPCMNKIPFPLKYSLSHASSILCYMFDVLPAGIFHRLVATCMQIPWKIITERKRPCIYQTAAIFTVQGHNVLLGMTPNEIQLQVFVIEGEVELSTCHEVKKKIDSLLSILSTTFQTDFKFMFGFKCKAVGFCDNQESSVIDEAEFSQPSFLCPSCPIESKHIIKANDITMFWIENLKETESFPTVSQSPLERTDQRERQRGEPFRKDRDDSYPLVHTQIIGKYEIGKRVGRIQFTKGGDVYGVGTGFRVGSKYVMTAYHVMGNKLEKLWSEVHKLLTEEERKMIEWTKDKLPVTGSWNISNLIPSLDHKRKGRVMGLATILTEQHEIKFEFLKEGAVGRIAKFKSDIAFVSPENDVLILELAELESEPRFFNLVEYNISEEKIHVFGHPDGIPLQHDPGCTIIDNETELTELKKEGIAFFKKEWPEKELDIIDDYAPCVLSEDKILFHSSKSTAHGASGAPLTIVVNDTIKVYGMLLNGHPKIFYNHYIKRDMKRPDLLVESGISMRNVRSLLESCLPELEEELFRST